MKNGEASMKTTNYENSKKLAEIGFKAETKNEVYNENYVVNGEEPLPSYDLETLLEALPKEIELDRDNNFKEGFLKLQYGRWHIKGIGYFCAEDAPIYLGGEIALAVSFEGNESLADTAARLLILLHEKNIINFN